MKLISEPERSSRVVPGCEHLAGAGEGHDPRRDVDGQPTNVAALQLDLAGVNGSACLDADARQRSADLLRRADGTFGPVENGHEPIAGRRHLPAAEAVE
jgi:hypothetical protein